MVNFTSNTYQMKRKILTFTNKISKHVTIHGQTCVQPLGQLK